MYEISKGHLMAMRAGIAVLLTLVTVLSIRLTAEPRIPPGFGELQRVLDKETSAGLVIFDITGKVTPFDRKLSPLKSCGESKDTTVPASCRPEGSTLLNNNNLDLLIFGKDKDYEDIVLGAGDTIYYRLRRCPDHSCCC
jgi:hypothetical protein